MKIVDLSLPLEGEKDCQWPSIKVRHQGHRRSRWTIRFYLNLSWKYLSNRLGWANDFVTLSSHSGTHLDAPWHFSPIVEGKKAKTIDEVPIDWCYGDGVVLDVRHRKTEELIAPEDIEHALKKIAYTFKSFDIVLIHTGMSRFYGSPDFFHQGPGMSREATLYILDKGVRVIGIDAWSFDLPLKYAARKARAAKDVNFFWQSHFAGIDHEYCHIEQLTNLEQLPPYGFKIACFPIKLKGGSAGWCRVVALIEA
jgi:kynurenine formamidase